MNQEQNRLYEILKDHKKNNFQSFYDLGFQAEGTYGCCGQCVIVPFMEILQIDRALFKYASGFCAGFGQVGNYPCGAFTGGTMILSYCFGRDYTQLSGDLEESKNIFRNTCRLVREYEARFQEKLNSGVLCKNVQTQIFGRSFDLLDKEKDYPLFEAMGAHVDKCTNVVGTAAQVIAGIVYDELCAMSSNEKV